MFSHAATVCLMQEGRVYRPSLAHFLFLRHIQFILTDFTQNTLLKLLNICTMRFLCLHGMGTSANIFESQLAAVRASIPGQHEFFFLDGQVEGEPLYGTYARANTGSLRVRRCTDLNFRD